MAGGGIWTGSSTRNIGNDNTDFFNSTTNELSRGPALSRPRWYASMVAMLDGTIYLQGGKGTTSALSTRSDLPERRNIDGSISLLTGADTYGLYYYYPRNFLAPDGRVFGYSDTKMYFVDTTGSGMVSGAGYLPSTLLGGYTQSEAMFRPFKVLCVGGAALSNSATAPGTTAAAVIDFAGPVPKITATMPMPIGLQWHDATTLPDGNVVVTGGSSIRNQLVGTNYVAYLWNSMTGQWSSGAPTTSGKARLYHSIALLLPDASVLVGGGGASTKTGGGPRPTPTPRSTIPPTSTTRRAAWSPAGRPSPTLRPRSRRRSRSKCKSAPPLRWHG